MKAAKTQPLDTSVEAFLGSIEDPGRQRDSRELVRLVQTATGTPPIMWGTSIIGFGKHHYVYDSGREGDTMAIGFAPRKNALAVYGLHSYSENLAAVQKLGKVQTGKGCLYIKDLAEVDAALLSELVAGAFKQRNDA